MALTGCTTCPLQPLPPDIRAKHRSNHDEPSRGLGNARYDQPRQQTEFVLRKDPYHSDTETRNVKEADETGLGFQFGKETARQKPAAS